MNLFAERDAPLVWEGARVTVLGLGRSGEAAARVLLERGADVSVLDAADTDVQRTRVAPLHGARIVLGRTEAADVGPAHLVVASPGIPPSSVWTRAAVEAGIPVWSEVELAYRLGARVEVAITGTNGKTTTTEMIAAALSAAGMPAIAAGNVGTPLCDVLDAERLVAEVSSFQLYWIVAFRARVAALLNVARDHLDWHGSFEAYARAKGRIFENQIEDDVAIYHTSCAERVAWLRSREIPFSEHELPTAGAGVDDGWIVVPEGRVVEVDHLRALGRPNRANAVAAAATACALGADPRAVGEGLARYEPKPHRVEYVATIDGVRYVNDSKASDPHATLAALEEIGRAVLIAGGRNKGLDLTELAQASDRLRAVVAIGEAADEVQAAFEPAGVPVQRAASMEDAVDRARATARPGDTVLLSPACASWDMFLNYEARGEAFRAAVKRLERGR